MKRFFFFSFVSSSSSSSLGGGGIFSFRVYIPSCSHPLPQKKRERKLLLVQTASKLHHRETFGVNVLRVVVVVVVAR